MPYRWIDGQALFLISVSPTYREVATGADPMSDVAAAIMDAAERRMRKGGFAGFSFREIAADVGIKSSSVHYHFPTKEDLAAAVIRRWAGETSKFIDKELRRTQTPSERGRTPSEALRCPKDVCALARCSAPPRRICRRKLRGKRRAFSRSAWTS